MKALPDQFNALGFSGAVATPTCSSCCCCCCCLTTTAVTTGMLAQEVDLIARNHQVSKKNRQVALFIAIILPIVAITIGYFAASSFGLIAGLVLILGFTIVGHYFLYDYVKDKTSVVRVTSWIALYILMLIIELFALFATVSVLSNMDIGMSMSPMSVLVFYILASTIVTVIALRHNKRRLQERYRNLKKARSNRNKKK